MTDLIKRSKSHSVFEIKAVDEKKRQIRGIATTPSADRVGDVVLSEGAVFRLPVPFLWQHDHRQPIGNVIEATVTSKGIEVVVELVKLSSPSQLAARLEEAWESIKSGLVRGLSIGFSPLKYAWLDNGGIEFQEWSWNELSAVTVPCNVEANITAIKSLSAQQALQACRPAPVKMAVKSVGVPTTTVKTVTPEEGPNMNIQEQIDAYKATLAGKQKELENLMLKSAETGATLNAEDAETYDALEAEIDAVGLHLKRLEKTLAMQVSKAVAVDPTPGIRPAAAARTDTLPAVAKQHEKLEPGQEMARYVMCLAAGQGNIMQAKEFAQTRYPKSERINNTLKAAVAAGTTTDPTWAAPLVEYNQFTGDFIEYLRPLTILGRFGRDGIPGLNPIPFNVNIRGQVSGGDGYWVGEGAPKPLTKFDFDNTYLGIAKVANIAVLSEELIRLSNPNAEILVRNSLAEALIERLDRDFINPDKAPLANVSPASITYGVTPIESAGNDGDAIRADVRAVMSQYIAANMTPTSGVWIMPATVALALSQMTNALGQPEFPGITMLGGRFAGLPVIVSQYVPTTSEGAYVVLANAGDIYLADDGQVVVTASREASLQMASDPTNDSSVPTPAQLVSMFQTNSVAIRAERYINWGKRRAQAVAVLSAVNWGM